MHFSNIFKLLTVKVDMWKAQLWFSYTGTVVLFILGRTTQRSPKRWRKMRKRSTEIWKDHTGHSGLHYSWSIMVYVHRFSAPLPCCYHGFGLVYAVSIALLQRRPKLRETMRNDLRRIHLPLSCCWGITAKLLVLSLCPFLRLSMPICVLWGTGNYVSPYAFCLSTVSGSESCAACL